MIEGEAVEHGSSSGSSSSAKPSGSPSGSDGDLRELGDGVVLHWHRVPVTRHKAGTKVRVQTSVRSNKKRVRGPERREKASGERVGRWEEYVEIERTCWGVGGWRGGDAGTKSAGVRRSRPGRLRRSCQVNSVGNSPRRRRAEGGAVSKARRRRSERSWSW